MKGECQQRAGDLRKATAVAHFVDKSTKVALLQTSSETQLVDLTKWLKSKVRKEGGCQSRTFDSTKKEKTAGGWKRDMCFMKHGVSQLSENSW